MRVHIKELKTVLFKKKLNICLQWRNEFTIAQANTKADKNGKIIEELVSCRQNLNFL